MSASSAQKPERRLLNRRLFLCERTSFRAPKVLDAFQNIRMSEKAQSSNVCTRCAHAPTPLPTAGIRFSFIKTKCYCAQWTVQLLNCPAQIIVDRCICHCVHCTTVYAFIFLTFQNQDRSMYSTKKWFCRHYTKRELSYFTFRRSKSKSFLFHSSFRNSLDMLWYYWGCCPASRTCRSCRGRGTSRYSTEL